MEKFSNFGLKDLVHAQADILAEAETLTSLNLSENQLTHLPEWIVELTQLEVINISDNLFQEFPIVLTQLPKLKRLNISYNCIRTIPSEIEKLHALESFQANYNQLKSIPDEFFNLVNLTYIGFWNNQLESLPRRINKLQSLTTLDISRNFLTSLPNEISELPKLVRFEIQGNLYLEKILGKEVKLEWERLNRMPRFFIDIILNKQEQNLPIVENEVNSILIYRAIGTNKNSNNELRYSLNDKLQNPSSDTLTIFPIEITQISNIQDKNFPVVVVVDTSADKNDLNMIDAIVNECQRLERQFTILCQTTTLDTPFTQLWQSNYLIERYKSFIDYYSNPVFCIQLIQDFYNLNNAVTLEDNNTPLNIVLKSINLVNIGHFEDTMIKFDRNMTCIIGPNGSGKSTILTAIASALLGKNQYAIEIPFEKLLRIQSNKNNQREYTQKGMIELRYQMGEVTTLGHISIQNNNIAILGYYNFMATKILNDDLSLKSFAISFSQYHDIYNPAYEPPRRHLLPNFYDMLPLLKATEHHYLGRFILWLVTSIISKEGEEKKEAEEKVRQVFDIINKLLGKLEVQSDDSTPTSLLYLEYKGIEYKNGSIPELLVTTYDSPNGIPISFISQGHKHLLGWLGRFIQRLFEVYPDVPFKDIKDQAGLVIIDEIDTSIHPLWQSRLLYNLTTTFPNIQFIVTSHSPLCIAGLNREQIIILDATKQGDEKDPNEAKRSPIDTWTLSANEILEKIFKTNQPEPTKTEKELFEELKKAKLDKDEQRIHEIQDELNRLSLSVIYENHKKETWEKYVASMNAKEKQLDMLIEMAKKKQNLDS